MFTKNKKKKFIENIKSRVEKGNNYVFISVNKDGKIGLYVKVNFFEEMKIKEKGIFNPDFTKVKIVKQNIETGEKEEEIVGKNNF